tara:strand:- start:89 stop:430 length:342 start_codon:yes stop_codon:yes gene_type:complete
MFLFLLLILVLIYLFIYKNISENFDNTCIHSFNNRLNFSLKSDNIKEIFNAYGSTFDTRFSQINTMMLNDLSNNEVINEILYDLSGELIDPMNIKDFNYFNSKDCNLTYISNN